MDQRKKDKVIAFCFIFGFVILLIYIAVALERELFAYDLIRQDVVIEDNKISQYCQMINENIIEHDLYMIQAKQCIDNMTKEEYFRTFLE